MRCCVGVPYTLPKTRLYISQMVALLLFLCGKKIPSSSNSRIIRIFTAQINYVSFNHTGDSTNSVICILCAIFIANVDLFLLCNLFVLQYESLIHTLSDLQM